MISINNRSVISKVSPFSILVCLFLFCGSLCLCSCNGKDAKNDQILIASTYLKEGDFEKAKLVYEKLADEDYPPAFTGLGAMYFNGQGVPIDKQKAIAFFQKGALGGDVVAYVNLGQSYVHGEGINKDCYKGLVLLKDASDAGYERASYILGNVYSEGLCGETDFNMANHYYDRNIEQGGIEGDTGKAKIFHYGYGVVKNLEMAKKYYQKAFIKGSPYAANSLGVMCLSSNTDVNECISFFEKSYKLGSIVAAYNIAVITYLGDRAPKDCSKSLMWAKKAAKKGHVDSMRLIGKIYESGCAGKSDKTKAQEWFSKAAKLGDSYSNERIANDFQEF